MDVDIKNNQGMNNLNQLKFFFQPYIVSLIVLLSVILIESIFVVCISTVAKQAWLLSPAMQILGYYHHFFSY